MTNVSYVCFFLAIVYFHVCIWVCVYSLEREHKWDMGVRIYEIFHIFFYLSCPIFPFKGPTSCEINLLELLSVS